MCEQTGKLGRVKEMTWGPNQGSSLFKTGPLRPLKHTQMETPGMLRGKL